MSKILVIFILLCSLPVFSGAIQKSQGELCITPDGPLISGAKYKKSDLKAQENLCEIDFNIPESSNENTAVALCPKLNSSFPGVDIVELAKGVNKFDFEQNKCRKKINKKNGKKIAKFKYSVSCSNSSAIVGYYHVSRALGINSTPAAVVRTMDLRTHQEVAERASAYIGSSSDLIAKTWRQLHKNLKNESSSIIVNGTHTLGVLSKNPRGEQKTYNGVYFHADNQKLRMKNFLSNKRSIYSDLNSTQPISETIPKSFNTENYSRLKLMKDASDMILLDTIFGQNDRFGNTHSEYKFAYINGKSKLVKLDLKEIKKLIKKTNDKVLLAAFEKAEDMPKEIRKEVNSRKKQLLALVIPFLKSQGISAAFYEKLILKDNDCGLRRKNPFMASRVLEGVNHMDANTYTQLVELYEAVVLRSELDTVLVESLVMSERDLGKFKKYLSYAAEVLIGKKDSGVLHLDLDPNSYFLN